MHHLYWKTPFLLKQKGWKGSAVQLNKTTTDERNTEYLKQFYIKKRATKDRKPFDRFRWVMSSASTEGVLENVVVGNDLPMTFKVRIYKIYIGCSCLHLVTYTSQYFDIKYFLCILISLYIDIRVKNVFWTFGFRFSVFGIRFVFEQMEIFVSADITADIKNHFMSWRSSPQLFSIFLKLSGSVSSSVQSKRTVFLQIIYSIFCFVLYLFYFHHFIRSFFMFQFKNIQAGKCNDV